MSDKAEKVAETLRAISRAGVIAVLRGPSADAAVSAATALIAGGVTAIEVTYSTPDAAAAISRIRAEHPDAIVGAGTLTRLNQVREAADAGATFLVSPGTTEPIATAMVDTGLPTMTGTLTPSEVMTALDLGVTAMKVFPGSMAGPSYLKALRGPFPDVPLMPTGGVSVDNLADWLAAGAFAVGAGSELCGSADMAAADWPAITAKAERFSAALAGARS